MAILDFNQAQANAWVAKAEDLNERTNNIMKGVNACLQEIQGESVGDMVDELVVTGAQMIEATANMVTALGSIVNAIHGIFAALAQAVVEAVAEVAGSRGKMTDY